MEEKMTKTRLLESMRSGRVELETLLARGGETRMDRPSSSDDWSLKDILAHISAWDRFMLVRIEADAKGKRPDLPGPGMTEKQVDDFNARTYSEHRDQPLDAVLAEFRESFQALLAAAEATPEEDLLDPNRFAWTNGKPLWYYFAVNSYLHYSEHLDRIRRIIGTH